MTVILKGQKELVAAFSKAGKDSKEYIREELAKVAEPVAQDATRLAVENIAHLKSGAKWSRMRIGVTQKLVYVVPAQSGGRGPASRRRPNFRQLMEPLFELALSENEANIEVGVNRALERIEKEWGI